VIQYSYVYVNSKLLIINSNTVEEKTEAIVTLSMAKSATMKIPPITYGKVICEVIVVNIRSKCLGTTFSHLELMENFNAERD
jgi:hypothetical protein